MTEVLEIQARVDNVAAKRCPDYDEDCALVRDHLSCWKGGDFYDPCNGHVTLEPVDGYCPFVFGMKS